MGVARSLRAYGNGEQTWGLLVHPSLADLWCRSDLDLEEGVAAVLGRGISYIYSRSEDSGCNYHGGP